MNKYDYLVGFGQLFAVLALVWNSIGRQREAVIVGVISLGLMLSGFLILGKQIDKHQ